MANEAVGHAAVFARKRNTGSLWYRSGALACGAGNQVEIESESFGADAQLIENMGLNGQATQLPGVKGNELHDGQIVCPLYYRGLEGILAQVMGTAGVASVSGDLHKHQLVLADTVDGFFDTFIASHAIGVREWPFVKWTGFELLWEDGQYGKLTAFGTPAGLNYNIGSPVTNRIVASVTPSNTTFTIANQPAEPSPVSVTITDGDNTITAFVVTFTGTDRDDNALTEVYSLVADTKVWVGKSYFKTITSVVGTGLTGSTAGDTIVCGVTNGVNNGSTVSAITFPSTTERNLVLFSQLELLINDQSAGALTAASLTSDNDEVYIKRAMIKVERPMEGVITTNLGNKRDEPRATGFVKITFAFDLADWNTANHPRVKEALFAKTKKKATLTATGPIVTATTATSLKAWLQNMQFGKGSPNTSGPGRMPFQIEGTAYRALSTPTGFPGAKAIQLDVVNGGGAVDALTL